MTRKPRQVLVYVDPELRFRIRDIADKYNLTVIDLVIKSIEFFDEYNSEQLTEAEYVDELTGPIENVIFEG